jgi:hypothetical protein
MTPACAELIRAARVLLATHPVFRLRPVGAAGSRVRLEQQSQIEAEDALIAAIAKVEAEIPSPVPPSKRDFHRGGPSFENK